MVTTKNRFLVIERTPYEHLRVEASEYRGTKLVNVRIHVKLENGDWTPTKKGITLRTQSEIDRVVDQLRALKETLPES